MLNRYGLPGDVASNEPGISTSGGGVNRVQLLTLMKTCGAMDFVCAPIFSDSHFRKIRIF